MASKVMLFVHGLGGGGAERVMVTIANGLARLAIQTQLVIVKPELTYAKELDPRVELINLNTRWMSRTVIPLARLIRKERPDALLATLIEANVTAVVAHRLSRTRTRLVLREANTPSRDLLQHIRWKKRVIGRHLRRIYAPADCIVAVSKGVYKDLIEVMGIPAHKVVMIPNPIPIQAIRAQAELPVEHPWLRPGAPPVVMGIGRLTYQKDFATLIRAFAQVAAHLDARLIILGEGEDRPGLEQLAQELGVGDRVALPGFDPNPYRYLKRSRLFVLSSAYEGFPNALIQAMVCGCPVVSTDCPSGPREILDGGRYGELVPIGDVDRMADAILRALQSPPPPVPEEWLLQFEESRIAQQWRAVLLPSPEKR